jgi:acyl carrier protein
LGIHGYAIALKHGIRARFWQSGLQISYAGHQCRAELKQLRQQQQIPFGLIRRGCAANENRKQLEKVEGSDMSDTAERVKGIVVEHLGVDAEKVTESASFIDDLGADSLDTVELVMAFEEEFGVEIPDDAAETILTVGDAVKFIDKATA